MNSSLSVVFTDSPKIEDHLFAKALRWADQNPDDIVFWARREPLQRIPEVDVEWSSKINALRRIRFGYNRKRLLHACIDESVKCSMGGADVAAIMCSMSPPKNGSQMGSLLAALAHFCRANDGRAVLVIDLKEEKKEEEAEEEEETDPFENFEFLEEEKKNDCIPREEDVRKEDLDIEKLKRVASMYTENVLTFDGEQFEKVSF